MKYKVIDSTGNPLRIFTSFKEASIYKLSKGNSTWNIIRL